MAEEEQLAEYQLVTEAGYYFSGWWVRETLKKSRGYTGIGTATYPNSDIYEGKFVDGVLYCEFKPFRYDMVMALINMLGKDQKRIKTLTRANGKTTRSQGLESKATPTWESITVTGQTEKEMEKVSWHTLTKMSILEIGRMDSRTAKEHMFSFQLGWNLLGVGSQASWLAASGNTPMELSSKEHLIIISLEGKGNGCFKMAM